MIKFKKLHKDAQIPTRFSDQAAGFDLYATESILMDAGRHAVFGTGISMELEDGYFGLIKPRSGLASRYGLDVLGGVVDSDYRGEVKVILINHAPFSVEMKEGDRIAQLIVVPHLSAFTVEENLTGTGRDEKGFGSTGV